MKFSIGEHKSLITYICCALLIVGFYGCWMTMYSFQNEYSMYALLCILGVIYACAICLAATGNNTYAGCVGFLAMIFVIAIAAFSNFKKADGTQDSTFIFIGVIPLICGILFSCVASGMGLYALSSPSEEE